MEETRCRPYLRRARQGVRRGCCGPRPYLRRARQGARRQQLRLLRREFPLDPRPEFTRTRRLRFCDQLMIEDINA